jgi:hypothetical protein
MKGDFSRLRFDRAKHYTAVVAQQGRVQLDADANEQRAIDEYLRAIGLVDIIGASGAPILAPGFAITVSADGQSIEIGPGRFYVDGLLCEASTATDYMQQPFLLRPTPSASALLTGLRRDPKPRLHVWLEAWQRLVTPLDDPGIKDVALGEADTTDRLQTVYRVVAEAAMASDIPSCCDDMRRPTGPVLPGLLTVGIQDASGQGNCLPAPHAGYRGLENQLYRIEVHTGGDVTQATFKWSRENGSVVSAISRVSGSVVTVDSLGPDANLGFMPGQWVEITDDNNLFGQVPNQPGQLLQIATLGPGPLDITLTQAAPDVGLHAKLRRWDQSGAEATANGVSMRPGGQNGLENGLFVQFSGGRVFNTGDYWMIPARTATGLPEWPPSDSNGAAYQPAKHTVVHRAPLACIRFDAARGFVVESCAAVFSPLTQLTPPVIPPALHVTQISWPNDDIISLDQLLVQGLAVTLDASPAPTIDAATFAVVLELPFAAAVVEDAATAAALRGVGLLRLMLALDGGVTVTTTGNTITWAIGVIPFLVQFADGLAAMADQGNFIRARVTLKGRAIRGANPGSAMYLDGQSYGVASTRSDGASRTDLALPSGNNEKASDFESWFYIAPVQRIESMAISPAAVAFVLVPFPIITAAPTVPVAPIVPRPTVKLVDNTSGTPNPSQPAVVPTLTLSLHYNALADTAIALSVSGGTPGTVTVPATVTIPKGAKSPVAPVPLTVRNPGGGQVQTITVSATLTLQNGRPTSAFAQIVVTGVAVPGAGPPIVTPGPILTPGGGIVSGPATGSPGPTGSRG